MKILKILSASALAILVNLDAKAADYDQRMPATELENGSANAWYRAYIRNGVNCYRWGPLRACDGPSTPFASYSGDADRGEGASGADAGDDSSPGDADNGDSGGSSVGGNSDSGGSGSSGPGGSGPDCRR